MTDRLRMALFLLCLLPQLSAAQALGRLFMTPAERAALEKIRHGGPPPAVGKEAIEAIEQKPAYEPVEGDEIIVLDGFVTRSGSGKGTTWINSVPQYGNEKPQGIAILRGKPGAPAIALKLPSGKNVHLKAGQNVDAVSGRVREGYETGTIGSALVAPPPATTNR